MNKPAACLGCPWYGDGKGYVNNDEGTGVLFLSGGPDSQEVSLEKIGSSQAGKDLEANFLPLAGLTRGKDCSFAHLIKCQGIEGGDATQREALRHCTGAYPLLTATVPLVVVQGKVAYEYASQWTSSIMDWRGFLLPRDITRPRFGETPVYVTLGVDDLYHNPSMENVVEWDYLKIRKVIDGSYPKPLPANVIATTSNKSKYREWFKHAANARWVTCDTEFIPRTKHLTVLGLLARYPDGTLSGLQVDWRTAHPSVREEIKYHYRKLVKHVPFIFHNCRADIPVLETVTGVGFQDYKQFEDTMLAHAVLWCELPHGLEFIASVWGHYGKLKHLKDADELLYNFGDVLETDAIWLKITGESFKHDKEAEAIYRSQHLKLVPILHRTVSRGLRINQDRVRLARLEYETDVENAGRLALATAGWPINLNSSKQLGQYFYTIRGLEVQINRKTDNQSVDDDAIATLRMALGPYYDPEETLTFEKALERINLGADPILEARVLYIGASTRLVKYIYPLYEAVGKLNPFAYTSERAYEKARGLAMSAVQAGTATTILDRMYPDMLIHTQKTGRWSTVDPPIAQLPIELRDIICPDPGEVWISWDWSAIEPRILAAYCGSRILERAFNEGIDLHTWTVCSTFGYEYPPDLIDPHKNPTCQAWRDKYKWKGKDDPRRVFAKGARYEMYYGGSGNNAAASAAVFGLDIKVLKLACRSLISADPEYAQWRMNIEEQIKRTRILRTFMGRPRRFLKGGHKMVREGLDYQAQGGVADMANTTVVAIDELCIPGLVFSWSMHDSQYWHCPVSIYTPLVQEQIRAIVERGHCIAGRTTSFPADFHIITDNGGNYSPKEYFALQDERRQTKALTNIL